MLLVEFSSHAEKFIKKNKSSEIISKLGIAIKALKTNPTPQNCKKLVGYPFYRIRVQSYRIVYKFDQKILYIALIAKRDEVYKDLEKVK